MNVIGKRQQSDFVTSHTFDIQNQKQVVNVHYRIHFARVLCMKFVSERLAIINYAISKRPSTGGPGSFTLTHPVIFENTSPAHETFVQYSNLDRTTQINE